MNLKKKYLIFVVSIISLLSSGCIPSNNSAIIPANEISKESLNSMNIVEFSQHIASNNNRRNSNVKTEHFTSNGIVTYIVSFSSNSILPGQLLTEIENYCKSYSGSALFTQSGWCLRHNGDDFKVMLRSSRKGKNQYEYGILSTSLVGNSYEQLERLHTTEMQNDAIRADAKLQNIIEMDRKEEEKKRSLTEPKNLGQRICKDYKSRTGGSMIGAGNVNMVGEQNNIQILVDRIYINGQPPQLLNTTNEILWDTQYNWYSCQF